MKRVLSILLFVVMAAALLAGCTIPGNVGAGTTAASDSTAAVSSEAAKGPVTLTLVGGENSTYPTTSELWVVKAIQEAVLEELNIVVERISIPDENFEEKANLMMASRDLPDMIGASSVFANKFGSVEAFVDVTQYIDSVPNFAKIYNDPDQQPIMSCFKSVNGEMFGFPSMNHQGNNVHGWFYRADIFEANNLSIPATFDELYTVCKKLKEIYPDSYPLILRSLFGSSPNEFWNQLRHIAVAWGTGHPFYFDWDSETWKFGPSDPSYKDMIMWFNKAYNEKLIPQDILTLAQDQFRAMMQNDQAFIGEYYANDINIHNTAFASANENNKLVKFMPPPAGGANGQQKVESMALENAMMCISSGSKKVKDALRYIDWFYSDEAELLVSWGREGETYKVVGGKKEYIKPAGRENDEIRKIYGFLNGGTYLRFDIEAKLGGMHEEYVKAVLADEYQYPLRPQTPYTPEEQKIVDNENLTIVQKVTEEVGKFLVGQRDFSEWEKFLSEMKALDLEKVLKVKNDSYQRSK